MKNSITVVRDRESGRIKFIRSSNFSYYNIKDHDFKYMADKHHDISIPKNEKFETCYKLSNKDELIDVDLSDVDSINPNIVDFLIVDNSIYLIFETEVDGSPTKTHVRYDMYCVKSFMHPKYDPTIGYKDYCKQFILFAQDIYNKTPCDSIHILENIGYYDDVNPVPYKSYNYAIEPTLLLGPAINRLVLKLDYNVFKAIYRIECANEQYTASILKDFPELIPWQTYKLYAYKSLDESYCIQLEYMELLKYISEGNSPFDTFRNQDVCIKVPNFKLKTIQDGYVTEFTYWKNNLN